MNIVIIGCGYIGTEVAKIWRQKGHHITATTRSPERLNELSLVAQKTVILQGDDEEKIASLIAANEAVLVSLAPDAPDQYETTYLQTAKIFRHLALEMNLPRTLIYTSSTSVYGDHQGLWVDETSDLLSNTDQGKILIDTERTYLSLDDLGWQVCILRLAEIYGPERELSHRVRELIGHRMPGLGNHYTNMVHKTDAASAIDYALRHHLEGVYNIADDDHPTRKELYDHVSNKFNLPKVAWDAQLKGFHGGKKRVSNHKIKSEGFSFRYPHRILN